MEVRVYICVILSLVIVSTGEWALKIWKRLWVRPKMVEKQLRELGFNGNPYKFGHGDMIEFARMRREAKSKPINLSDDILPRVLPFHHHIITNYGKNSYIWIGSKPRLNIMDPMLVKEIYSRPNEFHKPYPDPLLDQLVGGLLSAHGKTWSKHRKIINPAFHLERLKRMAPAIILCCENMMKKWEILVPRNGSSEVDVWPFIEDLSIDLVSGATLGSNQEERITIYQLHKEQADLAFQLMMGTSYFSAFRPSFLPRKPNKRMAQLQNEMQIQVMKIIDRRKMAIKMGMLNEDDMLGILLKSNSKRMQGEDEDVELSIEEVINECKGLFITGVNSTSRFLVWTMIMLSAHPIWQARAREEVSHVLKDKKNLDFDSLSHLKIVTMILQEVLRLYPPTSMVLRTVSKKTKLGNMVIPPWVQMTIPIIFHQYDPNLWGDDAKEFNPERFSKGISDATKCPSSFLPFTGGPRICIGHNFAMIEAKIAVAMMLKCFTFELSPSYIHAPELFFLLRPQYGAQLILHKLD